MSNEDHRIVVKVRFDEVRRGDLIVSVDPRGARGVRLVSLDRPRHVRRASSSRAPSPTRRAEAETLTESAGAGDSDLAPEDGSTPWIARG